MPDALAGLAASAALAVSDIPFNGPISEVRVARIDGKFVINPTFTELEKADMYPTRQPSIQFFSLHHIYP